MLAVCRAGEIIRTLRVNIGEVAELFGHISVYMRGFAVNPGKIGRTLTLNVDAFDELFGHRFVYMPVFAVDAGEFAYTVSLNVGEVAAPCIYTPVNVPRRWPYLPAKRALFARHFHTFPARHCASALAYRFRPAVRPWGVFYACLYVPS